MTVEIGLSLGGNQGDRIANLSRALDLLHGHEGVEITAVSHFYDTPPWGVTDQPTFINLCATARTTLSPDDLLAATQNVEKTLGRVKTERWGPRLIDVDILFYGDEKVDVDHLIIPHKHVLERAFVLVPLLEIAPDLKIGGVSIADALTKLADNAAGITKRGEAPWASTT